MIIDTELYGYAIENNQTWQGDWSDGSLWFRYESKWLKHRRRCQTELQLVNEKRLLISQGKDVATIRFTKQNLSTS